MTRPIPLEMRPSYALRLAPTRMDPTGERGMWHVKHGDVYGFGASPEEAMEMFDRKWRERTV